MKEAFNNAPSLSQQSTALCSDSDQHEHCKSKNPTECNENNAKRTEVDELGDGNKVVCKSVFKNHICFPVGKMNDNTQCSSSALYIINLLNVSIYNTTFTNIVSVDGSCLAFLLNQSGNVTLREVEFSSCASITEEEASEMESIAAAKFRDNYFKVHFDAQTEKVIKRKLQRDKKQQKEAKRQTSNAKAKRNRTSNPLTRVGGAVSFVNDTRDNTYVSVTSAMMKSCVFCNCHSSTAGGALYVERKLTATDCLFYGCSVAKNGHGSSMFIYSVSEAVVFAGGIFDGLSRQDDLHKMNGMQNENEVGFLRRHFANRKNQRETEITYLDILREMIFKSISPGNTHALMHGDSAVKKSASSSVRPLHSSEPVISQSPAVWITGSLRVQLLGRIRGALSSKQSSSLSASSQHSSALLAETIPLSFRNIFTNSNEGGAMHVESSNVAISNVDFSRTSSLCGGAVYIDASAGTFSTLDVAFKDCSASFRGGALFIERKVKHSDETGETEGKLGQSRANANENYHILLNATTITQCDAVEGGGIFLLFSEDEKMNRNEEYNRKKSDENSKSFLIPRNERFSSSSLLSSAGDEVESFVTFQDLLVKSCKSLFGGGAFVAITHQITDYLPQGSLLLKIVRSSIEFNIANRYGGGMVVEVADSWFVGARSGSEGEREGDSRREREMIEADAFSDSKSEDISWMVKKKMSSNNKEIPIDGISSLATQSTNASQSSISSSSSTSFQNTFLCYLALPFQALRHALQLSRIISLMPHSRLLLSADSSSSLRSRTLQISSNPPIKHLKEAPAEDNIDSLIFILNTNFDSNRCPVRSSPSSSSSSSSSSVGVDSALNSHSLSSFSYVVNPLIYENASCGGALVLVGMENITKRSDSAGKLHIYVKNGSFLANNNGAFRVEKGGKILFNDSIFENDTHIFATIRTPLTGACSKSLVKVWLSSANNYDRQINRKNERVDLSGSHSDDSFAENEADRYSSFHSQHLSEAHSDQFLMCDTFCLSDINTDADLHSPYSNSLNPAILPRRPIQFASSSFSSFHSSHQNPAISQSNSKLLRCGAPPPFNLSCNISSIELSSFPNLPPLSVRGSNLSPIAPVLALSSVNAHPPSYLINFNEIDERHGGKSNSNGKTELDSSISFSKTSATRKGLRQVTKHGRIASNSMLQFTSAFSNATQNEPSVNFVFSEVYFDVDPSDTREIYLFTDSSFSFTDVDEKLFPALYLHVSCDQGMTWSEEVMEIHIVGIL